MGNTKEKIWIYSSNKIKKDNIVKLAQGLGMETAELEPDQLGFSVGSIVGIDRPQLRAGIVPAFYSMPELLIFFGISSARLDVFLDAYKKAKIAPVQLKAMVTPFNSRWSLYQLIEELKREQKSLR